MFKDIIPSMVQVLEQCVKDGDEEGASQIFEVFDTLLMLVKYFGCVYSLAGIIDGTV